MYKPTVHTKEGLANTTQVRGTYIVKQYLSKKGALHVCKDGVKCMYDMTAEFNIPCEERVPV